MLSLLFSLLDAGFEPVLIISGRLDISVLELLFNVFPDLAILQERVQSDQLHLLLVSVTQLV